MFKKKQPLLNKPKDNILTRSDFYCPVCGCELVQNDKMYYCSDWDSQGGCTYKIKKCRVKIQGGEL